MESTNKQIEQEFIGREQAKGDAKLLRQLRAVQYHRIISRKVNELLSVNGLIEFGGPSETCKYNHYRLTALGRAELDKLCSRVCLPTRD